MSTQKSHHFPFKPHLSVARDFEVLYDCCISLACVSLHLFLTSHSVMSCDKSATEGTVTPWTLKTITKPTNRGKASPLLKVSQ